MALWKVKERKKECEVLSRVWLFATPWTVAYQPSPSMGFSRQGYWSGLLFPSPGDLPYPGIEPGFTTLQVDTLPFEPPECILKRCHIFLYQSRLLILPVFITGIVCVCVCVLVLNLWLHRYNFSIVLPKLYSFISIYRKPIPLKVLLAPLVFRSITPYSNSQ